MTNKYTSTCADCKSKIQNGKLCSCQTLKGKFKKEVKKSPFSDSGGVFSAEIDPFND